MLLPADKDTIRAICNLNDASIVFKNISVGSNNNIYYCNIKTKYIERTRVQILYKDWKFTPKKENNYIMIYELGKYIYVTGKELLEKGINHFRNLSTNSEEFKDKELKNLFNIGA